MKPPATDSLDLVELVTAIEEVLDMEVPGNIREYDSLREIVDRLERSWSNSRPNDAAKAMLKKLAHDQQWPELAEGLDKPWRREQIAAIVRELFREQ